MEQSLHLLLYRRAQKACGIFHFQQKSVGIRGRSVFFGGDILHNSEGVRHDA